MPNPDLFYDRDGITIWHGDCFDVQWPTPDEVGLLLTDPPYGVSLNGDHKSKWGDGRSTYDDIIGDDQPFNPTPLIAYRAVIWGGNCFASRLPDNPGWIAWDKVTRNGFDGHRHAELEFAWTNFVRRPVCYRHMWSGAFRDSERGTKFHPSQKPVALMRWIVDRWTEPGDLVFDPYMGSGPVAQACLELGRRYVGIELVEEYCQAAVDRLNRTTPSMFEVADAQS